jgi:predicted RNA-binding protein YlxR (DUF448 family)
MSRKRERPAGVDSSTASIEGPVRTCVGCRSRDAKPALLRVVVVDGALAVDRTGRLPGRGASVHPDPACVELADRRRAFPRALRVPGPLDTSPVMQAVQSPTREQVEKRA